MLKIGKIFSARQPAMLLKDRKQLLVIFCSLQLINKIKTNEFSAPNKRWLVRLDIYKILTEAQILNCRQNNNSWKKATISWKEGFLCDWECGGGLHDGAEICSPWWKFSASISHPSQKIFTQNVSILCKGRGLII